jgi:hypothetical protein
MSLKKYKRASTNMTISIFYEQNCLKKYNFEPPYQRDYNVWSPKQKSFLIDTIFKNFPMPPVFLEQKINDGKTMYDVIDGKQRLNTIMDFINNKVALPLDFGKDIYGNSKINDKNFEQIKKIAETDDDIAEYVDNFWSYVINIEYIEKPDVKIVDNIFDRLNRGGERLNNAELRKAKYYDTIMYQGILTVFKNPNASSLVKHLDAVRLQNISFLTEIYLLVLTRTIINGVEKDIDIAFETHVDKIDKNKNLAIINTINNVIEIFDSFDLDFEIHKIQGTSHLYALIYVALYIFTHNASVSSNIKGNLNNFYVELRSHSLNPSVVDYSTSMQSASKYKHSRRKRVKALLNYLGFSDITVK